MRRLLKKYDILRRLYYRVQIAKAAAQDDSGKLVEEFSRDVPKTFVEFGFHPIEFNCIALAKDRSWSGLLIDGCAQQVADATRLFHEGIKVRQAFLTLDNLDVVRTAFPAIGVLSIDVDGNDYWFLKALIDLAPSLICVEYNASLGLAPITVPYDPAFDRHARHPRGWYHGASLTALAKLCAAFGYGLASVSDSGTNAFFSRAGNLDPEQAWRPSALRFKFSGVSHQEQWRSLKDFPFESV